MIVCNEPWVFGYSIFPILCVYVSCVHTGVNFLGENCWSSIGSFIFLIVCISVLCLFSSSFINDVIFGDVITYLCMFWIWSIWMEIFITDSVQQIFMDWERSWGKWCIMYSLSKIYDLRNFLLRIAAGFASEMRGTLVLGSRDGCPSMPGMLESASR